MPIFPHPASLTIALLLAPLACHAPEGGGSGTEGSSSGEGDPSGQPTGEATDVADSTGTSDDATTIRFLHFNDLHAHLLPHVDLVADPGSAQTRLERRGGIARLATLVAELRAEQEHSVLMNVGDTFHGGVEALYTNGNAIVGPVEALGIDVGVPGNWDFAFGPAVTRQRFAPELPSLGSPSEEVEGPSYPNLAANVQVTAPPAAVGPLLPATHTMGFGPITVGFVGLTSDIVPRMHPILATGLEFAEGEAEHLALMEQHAGALREGGAQVVVVMSELGIHKDHRLAQQLPAGLVDVIFSAHTHEITWEPLTGASGTLVVEAGNDGYLGVMDLTVQGDAVVDAQWSLRPITDDIAPDPTVAAIVDQARAPFLAAGVSMELPTPVAGIELDQPIDTVVGQAAHPLHRRHPFESPFNDAVTDMQRALAGTDVAMTPGFRFDAVFDPTAEIDAVAVDAITLEDAYRFFPVVYTLGQGTIDVAGLRAILEDELSKVFSPDVFAQSGGWVPGFSGIEIDIDLSGPDGAKVVAIRLEGQLEPLPDDAVLTMAGCRRPFDGDDVLCSHGGFSEVVDTLDPSTMAPWSVVDMLVEGLATVSYPPRASVHDSSGAAFWPQGPFIQPLEGLP
ncbi:MAG: 5'-nucleotidase C-terminal domain-containing protein [Myxococcales bacterium]|nr:5'-nucleotidase C-terminal domain-containing protein [Myxococcales bacterium]